METVQILFLVVLGLFLVIHLRRWIRGRTIPHVDPADLSRGAVLVDVRTDAERSRDRIDGSIHIPLHQLRARAGELEKHKGGQVICYCATGNRSLTAAVLLKNLGYSSANLKGGITNWKYHRLRT